MPILPLSHPEPFAAVLGVMLHPREKDQAKAEARAFQYLGVPLEKFHRRGGELPRSDLKRIAEGGRPGRTTKIHALTDPLCRPVAFLLTPGQKADITAAPNLLALAPAMTALIADKAAPEA